MSLWQRFLLGDPPEFFHLIERETGKAGAGAGFHGTETAFEFAGGLMQRSLGLDTQFTRPVHKREEQVADLVRAFGKAFGGIDLCHLLDHLGTRACGIVPVEADCGGAA